MPIFTWTDLIVMLMIVLCLMVPRLLQSDELEHYSRNGYLTIATLLVGGIIGAVLSHWVDTGQNSMLIFTRIISIAGILHLVFVATALEIFRRVEIKRAIFKVVEHIEEETDRKQGTG